MKVMFTALFGGVLLCTYPVAADEALLEKIATADTQKGEKVFKKCKACHTVEKGGKAKTGPNLWGILNKDVASSDGYTKYSKGLKNYGGIWSAERLNAFLKKPKSEVKKTKMTFAGLKKEKDRLNLIAYLGTQSDTPVASTTGTDSTEQEPASADEYGLLVNKPGAEETFNYCTACHSERIVAQQGLTEAGWEELLDWMVDEQGMDPIDEPDRSMIIKYLTEHYNLDRPNFPR
ncbi:c-type cytochrome [Sneathiella aquimaris]|uniref:c-type cytochrome n=1 Tax=Sneathiella aquimaris TaxID=2599305 RepID=UPI00146B97BB|nr:cytochrome c family protein [Sneathiella aquimaris]